MNIRLLSTIRAQRRRSEELGRVIWIWFDQNNEPHCATVPRHHKYAAYLIGSELFRV